MRSRTRCKAALAALGGGAHGFGLGQGHVEPLPRSRAARRAPTIDLSASTTCSRSTPRAGIVEAEGMMTLRRSRRRDARARRHARGRAAAQVDHARRRGRRRGHRGDVVPPRPRARHDRCARGAHRRRAHRDLHGATTSTAISSSAFPNSYGTLGYALEGHGAHAAGEALRRGRASRATPIPRRASPTLRASRRIASVDFLDGVVFARGELYLTRGRFVDERALDERLQPRAHLLPLDPRARERFPHRARLPLALGHRLVLVLEERRRAASAAAAALRPRAAELDHLPEDHALERALGLDARAGALRRRAHRVGDPGRRHSARATPRSSSSSSTPRSASCRSGSVRSVPRRRRAALPALSARDRYALRQLRLLGRACASRTSHPPGFHNRADRAQGAASSAASSRCIRIHTSREDEFWSIYDRNAYLALKRKYDPRGALPDLYAKVVKPASRPQ